MKKIFLLLITIIFSTYLLTGCSYIEEMKIRNYAKKQAKIYLENKYGEEFKYKKSYQDGTEFNAVASTYTVVFDKATVKYSTTSDRFSDDYQSKKINEDLMKYMEDVFPQYGIKFDEKDAEFSSKYTTYYNGNISEFIEASKQNCLKTDHWIDSDINIYLKKTYCICEDNENIQTLGYKIKSEIPDKISRIIIDEIVFVNKDCYENSIKNAIYPTIYTEGCFAEGSISDMSCDLDIPKWYEIFDGVSIGIKGNQIKLNNSNVKVEEVCDGKELQTILDKNFEANNKSNKGKYTINARSKVYKITFNDSVYEKNKTIFFHSKVNSEIYKDNLKLLSCFISKDNSFIDQDGKSLASDKVEEGDRYFFVGSAEMKLVKTK